VRTYKYVILGGGVAGGYAAQEFAHQQIEKGEVALVTADEALPYERPPLSKTFLAGEESLAEILIEGATFYREHGIVFRKRQRVVRVDFRRRRLHCDPGGEIGFEKLLLATGSELNRLRIPGSHLAGVHYLRLLRDSVAIRHRMQKGKRAVVIGSGFIGLEVSSVLARHGVQTTLVFSDDRVWKRFFTPQMSAYFENYFRKRGVVLRPQEKVKALLGDSRVKAVQLETGEEVPADFVVAGIGVKPATQLFQKTPLKLDDGIRVNEFLETSLPGVWAAGDAVNYPDPIFGKRRRVEHWDNAVEQGRVAARNMLGKLQPFIHVPYFFSDVFDLSYEFWGDTASFDQVIHRGAIQQGRFSVWWLKEGCPQAVFIMNRPDEERELAPKWIIQQRRVPAALLKKPGSSLRALENKAVGRSRSGEERPGQRVRIFRSAQRATSRSRARAATFAAG
jgi:NADPH-dependent 2,4-dienoyl-CoA reductase/sulfur reductase-like enzyme